MRPTLQLTVTPDLHSDWARVNLVATVELFDKTEHDVVLYDQLRMVQPLESDVPVELWTSAVLADVAHVIQTALTEMIRQGSITLISGADKQQEPLF